MADGPSFGRGWPHTLRASCPACPGESVWWGTLASILRLFPAHPDRAALRRAARSPVASGEAWVCLRCGMWGFARGR
jgi:hypothetical protein